jgi:tRNA modification GTPase
MNPDPPAASDQPAAPLESPTRITAHIDRDTIVAIATPPGRGGIGIVRLSGPQAMACATPLLRLRAPLDPGRVRFCEIIDPETSAKLDEAVATWFAAPRSYTGEDVVEIAAHGSTVLLDFLVRHTLSLGARLANPGEFTERAFLSGRLDLTQAEGVRDLIEAQTLYQARVAASQLDGALSHRVQPIKQELVRLIAVLEAGIDFAEDDTPVVTEERLTASIQLIAGQLASLDQSFIQGRLVHSGFTLAIVGEPNVGKSSLFNRLVERERAIVTAVPGTTRDLVSERVSLGGIPIELIDTAGLRTTSEEVERIGIQKSHEALADADLVLLVFDATEILAPADRLQPLDHHTPTPHEQCAATTPASAAQHGSDIAALLRTLADRRVVLVLNKSDLLRAAPSVAPITSPSQLETLRTSTYSELTCHDDEMASGRAPERIAEGQNLSAKLAQVRKALPQAPVLATSAQTAIASALQASRSQLPHEMLLLDLYSTLSNLNQLTGETTSDDILSLIFSTFCIGK